MKPPFYLKMRCGKIVHIQEKVLNVYHGSMIYRGLNTVGPCQFYSISDHTIIPPEEARTFGNEALIKHVEKLKASIDTQKSEEG